MVTKTFLPTYGIVVTVVTVATIMTEVTEVNKKLGLPENCFYQNNISKKKRKNHKKYCTSFSLHIHFLNNILVSPKNFFNKEFF